MLPDVSAADGWAAVPALALLVVTAVTAVALPARRAASLDPLIALLSE